MDVTEKPLFAVAYRQQGTTAKRYDEATQRRASSKLPWDFLLEFFTQSGCEEVSFLLLAAERVTNNDAERMARDLELAPEELALLTAWAKVSLATDKAFVRRFRRFLRRFERHMGDEREQAFTVQDDYALTYEQIALLLGWSWQRVQQVEQSGLAKLRNYMVKNPAEAFILLEWMRLPHETAFDLTGVDEEFDRLEADVAPAEPSAERELPDLFAMLRKR